MSLFSDCSLWRKYLLNATKHTYSRWVHVGWLQVFTWEKTFCSTWLVTALSNYQQFHQNQMFSPGPIGWSNTSSTLSHGYICSAYCSTLTCSSTKTLVQVLGSVWSIYWVTVDICLGDNRGRPAHFIPRRLNHQKPLVAALRSYFDPHQLL